MPQAADQIASPHDVHLGKRQRRPLHRSMPRPTLIHRPSSDELAVYGVDGSYTEALSLLRRALEDSTLMVQLRRVLTWGRAQMMSDQEIIEQLARDVDAGRMIICSRPPPIKLGVEHYAATHDKAYRALLAGPFEGSVPYMYLGAGGKVTVGIGKTLATPTAAHLVKFIRRVGRKPATVPEIQDAYLKVRGSIAGRPPVTYRKLTDLDLAPGEADRLLDAELQRAEDACRTLFGGWGRFPLPAQLALLDMVFNPGETQAPTAAERRAGRREHSLFQFQPLRVSVAKEAWAAASRECHRAGVPKARDLWTRDQFLAAAHLAPPRPDPHRAVKL